MKNYTIATLGSHSALQILKGAKDEGFKTLLITTPDRVDFYKQYTFIDKIITPDDFSQLEKKLVNPKTIIIPHGSFVAYLGIKENKKMTLPYFGNKKVLDWEADRKRQRQWLKEAKILLPKQHDDIKQINKFPIIVKSYGAAGGQGYFFAKDKNDFFQRMKIFKAQKFIIQEYLIGVTAYFHYFYSSLRKKLEIMSMDRRYETNADAIGRIPVDEQAGLFIDPSYVVVGNIPLVIRESLLPEVYSMGERVVVASKKLIGGKGLYGPFCLETIITPEQKIYVMEISCRIVAGTNLFINGSPYADLNYAEPMSTGRRIAREIKLAMQEKKLNLILD